MLKPICFHENCTVVKVYGNFREVFNENIRQLKSLEI